MPLDERDAAHLWDIVTAARLVRTVVERNGPDSFLRDPIHQAALIRQYEIIGEATKRLSDAFRRAHADIPWRRMAGMRDVLIHSYDRINLHDVWTTSTTVLPEVLVRLEALLPPDDDSGPSAN